jgi:hypothetical protein
MPGDVNQAFHHDERLVNGHRFRGGRELQLEFLETGFGGHGEDLKGGMMEAGCGVVESHVSFVIIFSAA